MKKSVDISDKDYLFWIQDLCKRYRQSQIKVSLQINRGILSFYWELGKDIEERQYDNKYGSRFYEKLSRDLSTILDNKKGLAPTSLRYTKYFYCLYAPLFENCRQLADKFDLLFSIPWSHHQKIIDKVKGDANKGLFFVQKTLENNWGRGVLVNFLETDLYERQGIALSNFLLELGKGFSFVGREYRLSVGGIDKYIDLLFYNTSGRIYGNG